MDAVALAMSEDEIRSEVAADIARSERALADQITWGARLHDRNLEHDPVSCLVCFSQR